MDEWKLTGDELTTAQELIDRAEPQTTTLKKLYGRSWDSIGSPTEFGMRFKASVDLRELQRISVAGKSGANAQLYVIKGGC
jgi:hypothetical protein